MLRYIVTVLRYLTLHHALLLALLVLQGLVTVSMISPRAPATTIGLKVEQLAANAELMEMYPELMGGNPRGTSKAQSKRNAQFIEYAHTIEGLYKQGTTTDLYRALAEYYTWDYEGRTDASRVRDRYYIELYGALAKHPGAKLYQEGDELPLMVWVANAGKGYLMPLSSYLPLATPADAGDDAYNSLFDTMLWTVPVMLVSAVSARLQRRGRVAAMMPVGVVRGQLLASVATAACALGMLLFIWLPGIIARLVLGGFGDIEYPVVYGADSYVLVTSAGRVLWETACLVGMTALVIALFAHLAVVLVDTPLPAVAFCVAAWMVLAMYPDYFTRYSAFRDIAHLLPFTYFNVEYVTGTFEGYPVAHELRRIDFEAGMISLGATAVLLGSLLTIAALVTRRMRLSRPTRRLLPGRALRTEVIVTQKTGSVSGKHFNQAGSRYARRDGGRDAHRLIWQPLQSARYTCTFLGLLARSRMFLGGAVLLIVLLAIPIAFPLYSDTRAYSASYYRDGALSTITSNLAAGVYGETGRAREDADGLRERLLEIVRAQGKQEQYRAIAAYERYRMALDSQGSPLAAEERDLEDAAPRATLLEALVAAGAEVYTVPSHMPAFVYLSYVLGKLPFPMVLISGFVLAIEAVRQRTKILFRQVPVSCTAEVVGPLLATIALTVMLYLGIFAVILIAIAVLNGWGDASYPVVVMHGGTWEAIACFDALVQGFVLSVAVHAFVSSALLCAIQVTWNQRVSVCALGCMLVASIGATSILANMTWSAVRTVTGAFPIAYFDVFGAAGYVTYTFERPLGLQVGCGVLSCALCSVVFVLVAIWHGMGKKGAIHASG